MRPIFFRDLHLISLLKCEKKNMDFFWPGTIDISEHSTKSDPKVIFELCLPKTFFFPKTNRDRVANNVFDLQKNFHEDRLSFPVYGEKINLGHFRPFLRLAVLKVQNFCQNWSSRAEKLATSLFLYEESEKIGLEMICRPPDSSLWGFFWQRLLNVNMTRKIILKRVE
jgi:hypothetical protein